MAKEGKLQPLEGMPAYQERVVVEHNELVEKQNALNDFIVGDNFTKVDSAERERLRLQYNIMTAYILVLKQRISNFA